MIKRPIKRFGSRGADYVPNSIGKSRRGYEQFSIGVGGYAFTFSHNWGDWKAFTEHAKEAAVAETFNFVKQAVRNIGIEAIKRCPHFSGALEHSIKVTIPEVSNLSSRGRVSAAVGVSSSWKSDYDRFLMRRTENTGIEYPLSSPQLIAFIHEAYDSFIDSTKRGLRRKRLKEQANGGVRVGSHFLSRAWYDGTQHTHIVAGFAGRFRTGLLKDSISIDYEDQDAINNDLSMYASSFNYIDEEDVGDEE